MFGVRERGGKTVVEDGDGNEVEEGVLEEARAKDDAADQAEEIVSEEPQAKSSDDAPAEEIADGVESAVK